MPPTISAIITTYNYGRFIAGALDSVLAQTHRPDEILVADDGSSDDTAATVARYADQGVRYVWQPNAGASAIRNLGLRETTGDLVLFLDADDRWLPDKTERQLAHLARYPQAGVVGGSEWQVFEDGTPPFYVRRSPVGAKNLYHELLVENSIGNASLLLIRRACFNRVGMFDEKVGLGQDWDMWLRIGRVFPIGVVDAPLINFTRHGGSMTAGQAWRRYESNRGFHRRYIGALRDPLRRLWLWRAAESMSAFYTAAALIDDPAQHGAARRMALRAAVLDPFYTTRPKLVMLGRALVGPRLFSRVQAWRGRG